MQQIANLLFCFPYILFFYILSNVEMLEKEIYDDYRK